MIVVQERLTELFDTLDEIQGHKPVFDSGTDVYLNKLLTGYFKEGKTPYPLIWMLPGDETEDEFLGKVEKRAEFILCTRNDNVDMYMPQRLATSFENVLIPLYDAILVGITKSHIATYDNRSVTRQLYPNYVVNENKNKTIDVWDAIKLTIDLEIHKDNNC